MLLSCHIVSIIERLCCLFLIVFVIYSQKIDTGHFLNIW